MCYNAVICKFLIWTNCFRKCQLNFLNNPFKKNVDRYYMLLEVGAPLKKLLPYFTKTQLLLPRGKTIRVKERQANQKQRQTVPPWVSFSSPNCQYHPILKIPLQCRNSPSSSCFLNNRAIQPQGRIRSACGCIPWFFTQGLLKLDFGISGSTMNVYLLSINPFLLLAIEWPSVYY